MPFGVKMLNFMVLSGAMKVIKTGKENLSRKQNKEPMQYNLKPMSMVIQELIKKHIKEKFQED